MDSLESSFRLLYTIFLLTPPSIYIKVIRTQPTQLMFISFIWYVSYTDIVKKKKLPLKLDFVYN